MPVRIGFLGIADLHAWSYVACIRRHPEAEGIGVWDFDPTRRENFAQHAHLDHYASAQELIASSDAIIIASENTRHAELIEMAAAAGKPILCEKPLAPNAEHAERILSALEAANVPLMTAFPCRYSPAYQRLKERVKSGDIGKIQAICSTNRGRCPFDWFVDKTLSGGGAMIDHVVHVADLLRDLLGEDAEAVFAQIGNGMYDQEWEDTAMLHLTFPSGIFATLDSSWSRSQSYKTWGDVTMNVVGEKGVLELDMFGQAVDHYHDPEMRHHVSGYGSNLDEAMVADFIRVAKGEIEPPITAYDGIQASRVAWAGYASVASGQPSSPAA